MQLTEIKLSSYQGLRNQPTGSLTVSKRYDCSEADLRLLRKIANEHDEGLLASTLSPEEQETALEILKLDANVLIVGPSDELAGRRFFVNPEVSVLLGRFTIGSLQIRESVAR
ncbi:MAG: hypothetical protein EBU46_16655, partial [Nitrosomonadaceae bacterium]|nr:hypothetical protein [Nitrosomonadaceae bacterium]